VKEPQQDGGKRIRSPMALFGLGFEITVPVVLIMYVGYKLDGWLGSDPWLMSLGALCGVAVGFYTFVRRVITPGQGGKQE
jgi:F0F1-type ATP synthase assembly protein I